jgi:hypothetical protein
VWNVPGTVSFVNLGSLSGSGLRSQAEAIAELDSNSRLHAVGTDIQDNLGLLWTGVQSGSTYSWSTRTLQNDLCACTADWDIREAYDINDSGVIIALADSNPTPATDLHAVLLVPVTDCALPLCVGDINDDDTVNGTDLAILLAAWGVCTGAYNCPADADCNGVVNGTDLAMLLANWGSCFSFAPGGPPSLEELVEMLIEDGESELAALLELVWPY